jgi:hypothetical protein
MLVFLGFSSSAYPAGNLHIGALEIHPFASVEQKYDDNIFLEPKNQEDDDWITTAVLGLALKMPLVSGREEDFVFKANYDANFIEFWDNNEQSRVDHNAMALIDLKFTNDLTLKIEDKFQKTADPATSELTALEKRFRNNSQVVLGYMREKIGFDLGYNNIRDDYDNLNALDKDEQVVTTTGYYQLFPKTLVFGEYNFGKIIYDSNANNSDSDYHQYRLGIKGEIAPKLSGVVKVGHKQTDYKDSNKKNFKSFTTFINLTYALKERSTLNIFAERSSEESSYSTNSYFEYNRIGLKLDHELLEKLFLVSSGFYQFDKYPDETTEDSKTAKREDGIWDGSIGLRYEMKDWVSLETGYEYKQRDSKFTAFDYKNNIFSAKASVLF